MATGIQLSELVRRLRAETGRSLNVAHGTAERDNLVYQLQRTQEWLWQDVDWPFLLVDRDLAVSPGQRLYNYPADLDFNFVNEVWTKVATSWQPVRFGVTPQELSLWDSDNGVRAWPVQRWRHNGDTNQMEFWPIPDQAGTVRVRGRKTLSNFVNDADVCTLDGMLIVLFAAADILARGKAEDAQNKLAEAQRLLRRLQTRQGAYKREPFVVGGGTGGGKAPRLGIDYIPNGYGSGGH